MSLDLYIVARILRPHGRNGEIRLNPQTDHLDILLGTKRVFLGLDEGIPVQVERIRMHKNTPLMKIAGIDNITSAETLRGKDVCLPRAELAPLEDGEYFLHDLVGLKVMDHEGALIGNVEWIMETGGTPVLVGEGELGEFLIPFSPDAVGEVDLEKGLLRLNHLPGLLEP